MFLITYAAAAIPKSKKKGFEAVENIFSLVAVTRCPFSTHGCLTWEVIGFCCVFVLTHWERQTYCVSHTFVAC